LKSRDLSAAFRNKARAKLNANIKTTHTVTVHNNYVRYTMFVHLEMQFEFISI